MSRQLQPGWELAATLLRIGLTLLAAAIIVLEANGFVIDFARFRVAKAGLLVMAVEPRAASVTVDGQTIEATSSQRVRQLMPGDYHLRVEAPGYLAWQRQVRIEPGRSSAYPFVRLFLATPILVAERPVSQSELFTPLVDLRLRVSDGELWLQGRDDAEQLVTRYLALIRSAALLDRGHAVVQLGPEVHVIDLDGSNDLRLLGVDDGRIVRLIPLESAMQLGVLRADGTVQVWQIR